MNIFLMMITAVTLNINGLKDPSKWSSLWSEILHADLICLQETHLSPEQEYSFQLHAQSYDSYYSHDTTNSTGICIAVKHSSFCGAACCGVVRDTWLPWSCTH